MEVKSRALIIAGTLTLLAAIAHLGCVIFGGDWYRFFGAGEQMALMAESGHWYPSVVTFSIVAILGAWSAFAFSGAGIIFRLPFARIALILISSVFLARALGFIFIMPLFPGNSLVFWAVSSIICLVIGIFYAVGTYQAWGVLGAKNA